ncbi:MAG TPA: N-methyl-D-aspartate receptor NMDAR2C subunit [Burkholderiaceae bacterium]|nr:N-methyl-D-aspartate receptor NMDAR2C subunit [Burkholderiaceae bacterium]
MCAHPDEVALALWFHDAIYEPTRANNEAQSAEWLARLAAAASVPSATIERLQALVMSTCHTSEPRDPDARVLVDIDLAILGAPRQRFDAYERQIRREYRWVPAPIYRRKRARALERFVARPAIYATGPFRAHFEQRARENIGRSIALLGQRT